MWQQKMSWEDCLQIVESFITKYLQQGKYSKILSSKEGVGYGFVDGDLFLM